MRIDVYVRDRILPIDYPSRPGADPTPLEVLLASLAACAGNTLNMVLRRKFGAKLDSLEVEARAERRENTQRYLPSSSLCIASAAKKLRRRDSTGLSASPKDSSAL